MQQVLRAPLSPSPQAEVIPHPDETQSCANGVAFFFAINSIIERDFNFAIGLIKFGKAIEEI